MFKINSPNGEVIGESILALVDGMGAFKSIAFKLLEEKGIVDPKPGKWYNLQAYLDAYRNIYDRLGDMTLKVIGMKIPEKAVLPPGLDSIEKLLSGGLLDKAYQMNARGGDIGSYQFTKTEKRKGIMTCTNPFPCAFDMGLITGFMNKLRDKSSIPIVKHMEGSCRMNGANMCKYELTW